MWDDPLEFDWNELETEDRSLAAEKPEEVSTGWQKESEAADETKAEGGGESWQDIESPAAAGLVAGSGSGERETAPVADKEGEKKEEEGPIEGALGSIPLVGGALKSAYKGVKAAASGVAGIANEGSRAGSATAFTQGGGGGGAPIDLSGLVSAIKRASGSGNRM